MNFTTGLMLLVTILGIVFYYLQKQMEEGDGEHKNDILSSSSMDHGESKDSSSSPLNKQCRCFSLAEIKSATNDFDDAFVIGKGGFGNVYKGKLDFGAGNDVAIKRLDLESNQGAAEFWAEIEMLSKFHHSHIVSLLGYCFESSSREMILVYEYMPNGSLEDHLHKRRTNCSPLTWVQRLNICIGAARGLDYLHTGTSVQSRVIHRDIKSSNILLDENLSAKITDFGLSRISPAYQLGSTTNVYTNQLKGTFGYIDGEYFATHRVTRKSDVYAFGVVLFEVLCGRPAVDFTLDEEEHSLAEWAKYCVQKGTIDQFVDPCLRGDISAICVKEFAQIAYKCLHSSPKDRPTMAEVVARLEFVLVLALQKQSGVTIIKKAWLLFSNKIPALHTKNYRVKPKYSNYNRSKQLLATTMAEVRNEGKNTGINIAEPTKSAKEERKNKLDATSAACQIGAHELKIFTFDELRNATRNFRPSAMVGVSDGESVYKGWVDGSLYTPSIPGVGIAVAIKVSNTDNLQSLKEWQEEVKRGKFRHPNLVKLIGYCSEDRMLCLVYEYSPKRLNLLRRCYFPWGTKMKIGIGAARGLAFLHPAENTPIHYRTFNSSNILLNENFEVQLYFGSASLVPTYGELSDVMSDTPTHCYPPPEYEATGHWYVKSDVYAFGVMMLDMIAGSRFLTDYQISQPMSLVEWAQPILSDKHKLQKFMDPWLEQGDPPKGATKAATLILSCLVIDPLNRPSMQEVVASLEHINALER